MCDVKIGESFCKGDLNKYQIFAKTKTLSVNLTLTGKTKAWRPGTGHIHFGKEQKDFFAWLPSVPEGEISGTISIEGKTQEVSGSGYHDHNWGNIIVADLLKNWWWGRVQCEEYTVIAVLMKSKNSFGGLDIPVFMVADSNTILADASRIESDLTMKITRQAFHPDKKLKEQIAQNIVYDYTEKQNHLKLILTNKEMLTSHSLLETTEANLLVKMLAKSADITPWYTRFYVEAELEILKDGKIQKFKGMGIQEKMDFE